MPGDVLSIEGLGLDARLQTFVIDDVDTWDQRPTKWCKAISLENSISQGTWRLVPNDVRLLYSRGIKPRGRIESLEQANFSQR